MKRNGKLLLNLLALGFLLSCIQAPEQIVGKRKNSIVLLLDPAEDNRPIGSGFFVEPNKIVTNIHVVAGEIEIRAKLAGTKKSYSIEGVTAFDLQNDLVILKVAGKGTPLSLGKGRIGEEVFAMRYPGGEEYKVTKGKIHSIRNSDKQLRLTAKLVGGNSGGPVLNSKGQVIGVARSRGDWGQAISSNTLKALLRRSTKVEALTEWQKRGPVKAYRHFSHGNYIAHEQPLDAIKKYDRAIELYPRFAAAYLSRGNAKRQLGRYLEAIEDYDTTVEFIPDHTLAYLNRGKTWWNLGRYLEAIEDWNKGIELNPDDASPYANRGTLRLLLGESENELGNVEKAQRHYKAAIEDFNKAIELNPDDADVYILRGAARFHLGKPEDELGNVEKAQRHYKAAIEDFNKAIELNPDDADAYIKRGVQWSRLSESEAKLGNAEEAQQYNEAAKADFEKAKELDPDLEK